MPSSLLLTQGNPALFPTASGDTTLGVNTSGVLVWKQNSGLVTVAAAKAEFATIADLQAAPVAAFADGDVATVLGYTSQGDGGGGRFYYESAAAVQTSGTLIVGRVYEITTLGSGANFVSVGGENVAGNIFTATHTIPTWGSGSTLTQQPLQGIVVPPSSGSGRWVRLIEGNVYKAEWFGVDGSGSIDSTAALQTAVNYCAPSARTLHLPEAVLLNNTITIPSNISGFFLGGSGSKTFVRFFGENKPVFKFLRTEESALEPSYGGWETSGTSGFVVANLRVRYESVLKYDTTGNTSSGSPFVTVANAASIAVGDLVFGNGIPNGTTVKTVSGTTIELTTDATATASGVALKFFYAQSNAFLFHDSWGGAVGFLAFTLQNIVVERAFGAVKNTGLQCTVWSYIIEHLHTSVIYGSVIDLRMNGAAGNVNGDIRNCIWSCGDCVQPAARFASYGGLKLSNIEFLGAVTQVLECANVKAGFFFNLRVEAGFFKPVSGPGSVFSFGDSIITVDSLDFQNNVLWAASTAAADRLTVFYLGTGTGYEYLSSFKLKNSHFRANFGQLTSGTLVVGRRYRIITLNGGDHFSGSTNVAGDEFTATTPPPTDPNVWTSESILEQLSVPIRNVSLIDTGTSGGARTVGSLEVETLTFDHYPMEVFGANLLTMRQRLHSKWEGFNRSSRHSGLATLDGQPFLLGSVAETAWLEKARKGDEVLNPVTTVGSVEKWLCIADGYPAEFWSAKTFAARSCIINTGNLYYTNDGGASTLAPTHGIIGKTVDIGGVKWQCIDTNVSQARFLPQYRASARPGRKRDDLMRLDRNQNARAWFPIRAHGNVRTRDFSIGCYLELPAELPSTGAYALIGIGDDIGANSGRVMRALLSGSGLYFAASAPILPDFFFPRMAGELVITRSGSIVKVFFAGSKFYEGTPTDGNKDIDNTNNYLTQGYFNADTGFSGIMSPAWMTNYALTDTDVAQHALTGLPIWALDGGSEVALTGGTLRSGARYIIDNLVSVGGVPDDFTNVGGGTSSGSIFIATGTTPTTWTNGSSLRKLGAVVLPSVQPQTHFYDLSGNQITGQRSPGCEAITDKTRGTIIVKTATNGNVELDAVGGATAFRAVDQVAISSWRIYSAGTVTVSLGNASGGAQYANAVVLAAGWNEITLLTKVATTRSLWVNANNGTQLKHCINYEAVA